MLLTPTSIIVSTLSTPTGSSAAAVEACSDKVLLAETLAGLEESGISSPPNLVRGGRGREGRRRRGREGYQKPPQPGEREEGRGCGCCSPTHLTTAFAFQIRAFPLRRPDTLPLSRPLHSSPRSRFPLFLSLIDPSVLPPPCTALPSPCTPLTSPSILLPHPCAALPARVPRRDLLGPRVRRRGPGRGAAHTV